MQYPNNSQYVSNPRSAYLSTQPQPKFSTVHAQTGDLVFCSLFSLIKGLFFFFKTQFVNGPGNKRFTYWHLCMFRGKTKRSFLVDLFCTIILSAHLPPNFLVNKLNQTMSTQPNPTRECYRVFHVTVGQKSAPKWNPGKWTHGNPAAWLKSSPRPSSHVNPTHLESAFQKTQRVPLLKRRSTQPNPTGVRSLCFRIPQPNESQPN